MNSFCSSVLIQSQFKNLTILSQTLYLTERQCGIKVGFLIISYPV